MVLGGRKSREAPPTLPRESLAEIGGVRREGARRGRTKAPPPPQQNAKKTTFAKKSKSVPRCRVLWFHFSINYFGQRHFACGGGAPF
jgi:hypothetical protein